MLSTTNAVALQLLIAFLDAAPDAQGVLAKTSALTPITMSRSPNASASKQHSTLLRIPPL